MLPCTLTRHERQMVALVTRERPCTTPRPSLVACARQCHTCFTAHARPGAICALVPNSLQLQRIRCCCGILTCVLIRFVFVLLPWPSA